MFFQNCSSAVPFGTTDRFAKLIESEVFPYEASFDQVAYMSCSEQENVYQDYQTFFTFRVGAYRTGGVRVTEEFRNEVIRINDEGVVNALTQNYASSGSRLQLAIRTMDNLQLAYLSESNGSDGLEGEDYDNMLTTFGEEAFTNLLWYMEPGDYLQYYAGAQYDSDYRFEGTVHFTDSEVIERDLRSFLSNRGVLAVTFSDSGAITPRGPGSLAGLLVSGSGSSSSGGSSGSTGSTSGSSGSSGINSGDTSGGGTGGGVAVSQKVNSASVDAAAASLASNVYGMAVSPKFKQPLPRLNGVVTGSPGSSMPSRVLSSIQEVAIDSRRSGTIPKSWTCPDEMQFMIVLPEDKDILRGVFNEDGVQTGTEVVGTRCATNPDPVQLSETLKLVRKSLYAEDWYVDLARRCIVPKEERTTAGSCYGINSNTQQTHIINYDNFPAGCGFGHENGLCPHYASICLSQ